MFCKDCKYRDKDVNPYGFALCNNPKMDWSNIFKESNGYVGCKFYSIEGFGCILWEKKNEN